MKISKDRVVCMDYTIRLESGRVVESSVGQEPLTYLHGRRQIVPGVEKAIEGLESGALLEVVVAPGEAYGDRDPSGRLRRAARRLPGWRGGRPRHDVLGVAPRRQEHHLPRDRGQRRARAGRHEPSARGRDAAYLDSRAHTSARPRPTSCSTAAPHADRCSSSRTTSPDRRLPPSSLSRLRIPPSPHHARHLARRLAPLPAASAG